MASVFTYDPDPPRVASPWSASGITGEGSADPPARKRHTQPTLNAQCTLLADCGITKLEAEPPEGPTEYKLHLLLRPRRRFSASSSSQHVSGSHHSKPSHPSPTDAIGKVILRNPSPMPAPSKQSRQNRLQQLTTQLLWRLQQSSPYHSSSTNDLILPVLPEATPQLGTPKRPARLLPGLEESRGALYEIGVSDDGSFIGLTQDEMEESLTNLRAMAASLGCNVELLRAVVVGNCEWIEEPQDRIHRDKLWVAEALILPILDTRTNSFDTDGPPGLWRADVSAPALPQSNTCAPPIVSIESEIAQLRVSLTGATTSGKSSLLGTLSTATLDNGRGKSRLSLLKHRHEIASGITSSVSQELLGYRDSLALESNDRYMTEVINYASGNVSSWNDIHAAAETGRLVFVSDSAGHPRYRRTAVRGLVSWAPHWTLCCIGSTGDEDSDSNISASTAERNPGLVHGPDHQHDLELCLKLQLPLVVVITKLDIAAKVGLRRTLAMVLSTLKSAGRQPLMLPTVPDARNQGNPKLIPRDAEGDVDRLLSAVPHENLRQTVPIVLTSVVNGTGISTVHALLRWLPLPALNSTIHRGLSETVMPHPRVLFHIDEVFVMPSLQITPVADATGTAVNTGSVVCGYLRYGELAIGDESLLGPLTGEKRYDDSYSRPALPVNSFPPMPPSPVGRRNHPYNGVLNLSWTDTVETRREAQTDWQTVRIVSIRNLRLPVHKLLEGQVGTIGIVPVTTVPPASSLPGTSPPILNKKIRKGMILAIPGLQDGVAAPFSTCSGFVATFDESDVSSLHTGSLVIVYIASIRASARIMTLEPVLNGAITDTGNDSTESEVFGLDDNKNNDPSPPSISPGSYGVTFQFVACREWIEVGVLALVMPAGGHGKFGVQGGGGLEGFVGRVSAVVE